MAYVLFEIIIPVILAPEEIENANTESTEASDTKIKEIDGVEGDNTLEQNDCTSNDVTETKPDASIDKEGTLTEDEGTPTEDEGTHSVDEATSSEQKPTEDEPTPKNVNNSNINIQLDGNENLSKNAEFKSKENISQTSSDSIQNVKNEHGVKFQIDEDNNLKDGETKKPTFETQPSMVEFVPQMSLLERLKSVMEQLKIKNPKWTICKDKTEDEIKDKLKDKKSYKVTFIDKSGSRCENILNYIIRCGVGQEEGSSISILPVTIHYDNTNIKSLESEAKVLSPLENDEIESVFKESITSRLVVNEVVQSVKANAELTFDYIMLIFLASVVAVFGLIENSSVVLVASMLISPLMGPILAIVFGSRIDNKTLRHLGLKNELIGLGICVLCGSVFGLLAGGLQLSGLDWRGVDEYPTTEMSSRGVPRSLVIGVLIALPSGAGVALSVLGGNTGSLVGVAISASLLPPAVNAGMLWSYSLLSAISPPQTIPANTLLLDNMNKTDKNSGQCQELVNNMYIPYYSCNMWRETAILGTISLLLTILNIICILVMGVLVLKIKEVVPLKSIKDSFEKFFHTDLKIARKSYQTHKRYESQALYKQLLEENQKLLQPDKQIDDKSYLPSRDVKLILRKNIETIASNPGVKDVTYTLNKRPFSDILGDSGFDLLEVEPTSKPNRSFKVETYTDELTLQYSEKLRKSSSVNLDSVQQFNDTPSINYTSESEVKICDNVDNPRVMFSMGSGPEAQITLPDKDKEEFTVTVTEIDKPCDSQDESEMKKPLLKP